MKNYVKRYRTSLLFVGMCLFSCDVFSASEATKKLIHETLAKYGISAGGKEICGKATEPYYNKTTGKVDCYNNKYKENNCWDKDSRLCKRCPDGTILNKNDYISCNKIVCPDGWKLIEVKDDKCPTGFKRLDITRDSCPANFKSYTEQEATKNYTTQSTNCKNIKYNN